MDIDRTRQQEELYNEEFHDCYCSLNVIRTGDSAVTYGLGDAGFEMPIPVAARSKAWVFGRSLTTIVGSNPTGGMDVCVVFVV